MTESNTLKLEKTSGSVAYLGDAVYRPVSIGGVTVTPDVDDRQPTPADGDDYTYQPLPIRDDGLSLGRIQIFDDTDTPLTYAALVRTVYRLQDEVAALAGQVVELRERMEKWTADS